MEPHPIKYQRFVAYSTDGDRCWLASALPYAEPEVKPFLVEGRRWLGNSGLSVPGFTHESGRNAPRPGRAAPTASKVEGCPKLEGTGGHP
jgi:hypothetical protein